MAEVSLEEYLKQEEKVFIVEVKGDFYMAGQSFGNKNILNGGLNNLTIDRKYTLTVDFLNSVKPFSTPNYYDHLSSYYNHNFYSNNSLVLSLPEGSWYTVETETSRVFHNAVSTKEVLKHLRLLDEASNDWKTDTPPITIPGDYQNPISDRVTAKIADHHLEQFGAKDLSFIGNKFAEESGEISRAIVRHLEQRDGRDWDQEIHEEIGQTIITLAMICNSVGVSLSDATELGIEKFLNRTWNNISNTSCAEESEV